MARLHCKWPGHTLSGFTTKGTHAKSPLAPKKTSKMLRSSIFLDIISATAALRAAGSRRTTSDGAPEIQARLGPTLLFDSFLPQSAQTQPRPTPTPIAFRRVSEYVTVRERKKMVSRVSKEKDLVSPVGKEKYGVTSWERKRSGVTSKERTRPV